MENKYSPITFVTIAMGGGGTERVIATLADYFVSLGIRVKILMIGGSDVAYKLDDRVELRCISEATGGSIKGRIDRIRAMRTEFKDPTGASIIAMGTVAAMFTSIASLGLKNRIILSERNDPNRLNHRPIKGYEKVIRNLLYRRADGIVFQTDMAKGCFPEYITRRGEIILNPIRNEFPEFVPYSEREKVVITAGRLTEQKNHKLLIDAVVRTHERFPDYALKIYGEGEYRAVLEEYIASHDAGSFIHLMGYESDILGVMSRSRIYVSSSDWEGISNSLAEAMACGMAVVATDCPMGGSAMLIDDGTDGRLVPVGDADRLTECLLDIMQDEESARTYAEKAKAVREKLSVENIGACWLNVVNG